MRTAWITLRHQPPYRSDAFANGFEELGFRVQMKFPGERMVRPEDVVVVWNLNPRYRPPAQQAARIGAALLVTENGYIPKKGASEHYYALARNGHNGSGMWFTGKEDRWSPLGQTIHDWKINPKGHVLIADQRGIGSELMKCPRPFYETVVPRMKRIFARVNKKDIPEFRLRAHPGRHQPKRTLEEDFKGARAVVTWASNVANQALLYGVPTFRVAPYHVNEAAIADLNLLPDPPMPDRLAAFKKLAWAQWSLTEINQGAAFRHSLRDILEAGV